MPLFVNPRQDTSSFQTLTDSSGLFTIAVPPSWGLQLHEVPSPDPQTTRAFEFTFPDGTVPFVVNMYTPAQWQDFMSTSGITDELIGQSSSYYFGLAESDDDLSTQNLTTDDVRAMLPTIYSTFTVK